jgi:hypothetical protein
VPFAGIAYVGWDTQRTADAVRALPLPLVADAMLVSERSLGRLPTAFA